MVNHLENWWILADPDWELRGLRPISYLEELQIGFPVPGER